MKWVLIIISFTMDPACGPQNLRTEPSDVVKESRAECLKIAAKANRGMELLREEQNSKGPFRFVQYECVGVGNE